MPLSLATLQKAERALTVDTGYGDLTVTYRPGAWTAEFEDRLRNQPVVAPIKTGEGAPAEGSTPVGLKALCDLLVGWDLIEEDGGAPVPITPASLARVPGMVLHSILSAVALDHVPNATRAEPSTR